MSDYLTKFMTADDDVYDCIGKRLKLEGRRRTVSFAPRSVYIKLGKAAAPLPTSESQQSPSQRAALLPGIRTRST